MDVRDAVLARRSVRAFRPDPVPRALVEDILDVARRAPSGGNLQPWLVYVLTGPALEAFTSQVVAQFKAGVRETPDYEVYPPRLWEPYRGRRREAGIERYEALGLSRDEGGQDLLSEMNYSFFGAPVGLFFALERNMGSPQWSDLGMFMQTIMLLAVGQGLATCPQEVWSNWPKTIGSFLGMPEEQMIFAGMAMGYADDSAALAKTRTARVEPAAFVTWRD
ncbi:nitroreductase [Rhodoligotrophos appendicifer]|uniref:nitroreductase n=1 Tax=Rhodoligotrophos appendicifer TaxID=987056 RepID=UPI0011811BFE|nr:nitroreductase [Rhodoligotrophos appendicifer]